MDLISIVDCDLCVTLPAYRKVLDLPLPDTWGRLSTILVKGGWEGQDRWSPDPARYAAAVDVEEVRVCRRCGTHYLYCQSHDPHWGEPRPAETDWSLERVPLPRARAYVRRTGLDGAVERLDGGWLDRRYETLLELLRRDLLRAPDLPIRKHMVDSLYGHYLGEGDWEGLRATLLACPDPGVGVYVSYRIFAAIDPGGPPRHRSTGTLDDVGAMLRAEPAREPFLVAVLAEGLSAQGPSLEYSAGEPVAVSTTAMRTLRTYVPRQSLAPAVPALAAALRRSGPEHGGWRQEARDLLIEYVGAAPERASEVRAGLAGDGDEVLAVRAHCQRCPAP